ncbi:NmrA family NAD(P)-binding protein [Nocardiopsis ansamitocini]|uniref:Oxidoreductase n=1 Tax=Nocardiopsis ansamitocini TaxID=1670832 RepID=A0A9W6PAE9_9ACTN|nr:NmrA family NAD(P)-binding protein [Nocardiopsis ansamitocini]GLU49962.1 oxidoreductase [Nocardiopsis ansamitocini]
MTRPLRVLVTGATGTTATALLPELRRREVEVTAASRNPPATAGIRSARFDWYDPATHDAALDDVDHAYLVPPPLDPDPAAAMVPFLERARRRGVRRAVLLSASIVPAGGPAVGRVHQALPRVFDEWAVVRPSWFMQNFTGDHPHAREMRAEGTVTTATGDGRIGFVDAGDIAAVAARALTDDEVPGEDLVLTGPEALSYGDVAEAYSAVTGRPVAHRAISQQALEKRFSAVMDPSAAAMLARVDGLVASGIEDRVTDTVERVTGRPPRSLDDVLRRVSGSAAR